VVWGEFNDILFLINRILTIYDLRKSHIFVVDWCCMSKSSASLGFIARELWTLVLSLFGGQWVMPKGVMELLDYWQG
jgi:hypothetical protein